MKTIFAKMVQQKIKEKVKGNVKCFFSDNLLVVKIQGASNLNYCYTQIIQEYELVYGLTTEMVALVVLKLYKSYIHNLFFM